MRRTAGGFLHPSEKLRLGELNKERLPSDAAGVARVAEPGSIWDYLPNDPDLDVNVYHMQYDFGDQRDVDRWNETSQVDESGEESFAPVPLSLSDWIDGHAELTAGGEAGDYYQYQDPMPYVYIDPASSYSFWLSAELIMPNGSESTSLYYGFTEEDPLVLRTRDYGIGIGKFDVGFEVPPDDSPEGYVAFIQNVTVLEPDPLVIRRDWRFGEAQESFEDYPGERFTFDLSFLWTPEMDQAVVTYWIGRSGQSKRYTNFLVPAAAIPFLTPLHLTLGAHSDNLHGIPDEVLINYLKVIIPKDQ